MNQLCHVVDDFIDVLLRDACNRVGLHPVKTKPIEWAILLTAEGCSDEQRAHNFKMVTYVVHHLLNAHKLTAPFIKYFEKIMNIPFGREIILTTKRGKQITLIDLLRTGFADSRLTLLT